MVEQKQLCDEDAFHEASKPCESTDKLNEKLTAFFDELYELRNKYGIMNLSVILMHPVSGAGTCMSDFHVGDALAEEAMAAWHLGRASADREASIAGAIAKGKVTRGVKRK